MIALLETDVAHGRPRQHEDVLYRHERSICRELKAYENRIHQVTDIGMYVQ